MDWLEPWWPVDVEQPELARAYERELQAELGNDHPLFGVPVTAIAKHDGCDDVLFRILDGTERLVVVHLTWARHPEPAPWPAAEFYADRDAFVEHRMRPDHDGDVA